MCDLYTGAKNSAGVSLVVREGCGWAKVAHNFKASTCDPGETQIEGGYGIDWKYWALGE